ncbi:MAG: 7-cyano-7-deazaguanine synthase QueC [Candidatus Hydrothermota bacterium]|nr:MAG: 7-cyano-7-deazaguanine synthase QueC [Candidatus Hydrothermae bacterium]
MMKKAVCLISGGLDSSVTAYTAKNEGYELFAITFNYKQKHRREIESAKRIAESVGVKKHILFDIDLSVFGGSSLVDEKMEIQKNNKLEDIGKKIPLTYVPARNTVFLSIGLAYAEVVHANTIFIGVTATDYSGYPDCRPEYIEAFQRLANLATKKGVEGEKIEIKAPLLFMNKSEIIRRGVELGVPFEETWSCYMGGEKACGRCDSCLLRLKGFKDAGLKDPLEYEYLPDWI